MVNPEPLPMFTAAARQALLGQGWRLRTAPAGLTLVDLRAQGAPFKGSRYFDRQADHTHEVAFAGGEIAYRPGLIPDSLGCTPVEALALLGRLQPLLPPDAVSIVAPAALLVWLLVEHQRLYQEWLLQGTFTWAADTYRPDSPTSGVTVPGEIHLAVGVFGRTQPLIVSSVPEGRGRGIGLLPVIVPPSHD